MILKHMDFDTIRSRISTQTITSVQELFRDLLLVANNGVVFYSKNTREYKTALALRTLVMKTMREHFKDETGSNNNINNNKKPATPTIPTPPAPSSLQLHKPPVKPRSARPSNRKPPLKVATLANLVDKSARNKKTNNAADSPASGNKKTNNAAYSPASRNKKTNSAADSPASEESLATTKKGSNRKKKGGGRGNGSQQQQQSETPVRGRKRIRAR